MQCHIVNVEPSCSHIFITKYTLLGGPLEACNNRVLDFIKILHSLGTINKNVGSIRVRTEAPDLSCFCDVIFILVSQESTSGLEIISSSTFSIVNVLSRPSGMGTALMNNLLCLLGDLDRHIWLDSSDTVSLYDTTGSDFFSGIWAWSSSRSLRQISRWSSPAPAMMCSPDSSMMH